MGIRDDEGADRGARGVDQGRETIGSECDTGKKRDPYIIDQEASGRDVAVGEDGGIAAEFEGKLHAAVVVSAPMGIGVGEVDGERYFLPAGGGRGRQVDRPLKQFMLGIDETEAKLHHARSGRDPDVGLYRECRIGYQRGNGEGFLIKALDPSSMRSGPT